MKTELINLYKFVSKLVRNFIKFFFYSMKKQNEYYNRPAGYRAGSVHVLLIKTHEVYKPASWKAPANTLDLI